MGNGDKFLAQTIDRLECAERLPPYSPVKETSQIVGGSRDAERQDEESDATNPHEESLPISFKLAWGWRSKTQQTLQVYWGSRSWPPPSSSPTLPGEAQENLLRGPGASHHQLAAREGDAGQTWASWPLCRDQRSPPSASINEGGVRCRKGTGRRLKLPYLLPW